MSERRVCDMCTTDISGGGEGRPLSGLEWYSGVTDTVRYQLDRHDLNGYFDTLDICSPECLAAAAVGEAHQRGERHGRTVADYRASVAAPRRRWWQKRAAAQPPPAPRGPETSEAGS